MTTCRHFLRLEDFSAEEIRTLIARAGELKQTRYSHSNACKGKTLGMIFELSSTRTRVAFETGMLQLGGHALFLSARDLQLGRGEPITDTAKVISRLVDIVMIRTLRQDTIDAFARASDVPVINGMSASLHPCQLLADLQTYFEHRGDIANKKVAFIGDGHNMCNSYIEASKLMNFKLSICTPKSHSPDPCVVASSDVHLAESPEEAASGAHLVVTDVWSSMGHDDPNRLAAFDGLQVNEALLDLASDDAVFLHCLPAHRGEEVNETVLDDARSRVWEAAENRMHTQKALIEKLLT